MLDVLRMFIITHPIVAAALSSLWGAVLVDLIAFVKAKQPGDFFGQFSFKLALFRYGQALVGGFLGNALIAGATAVIALWLWF